MLALVRLLACRAWTARAKDAGGPPHSDTTRQFSFLDLGWRSGFPLPPVADNPAETPRIVCGDTPDFAAT